MVQFEATIRKFGKKGEKTGWTYFEVPADIARRLKPNNRKEFKVKGKLDEYPVKRVSLLPMGGGTFIFVLNAALRKGIGKTQGAKVKVQLQEDKSPFVFNADFISCLNDEPAAKKYFDSLPGSHQRYISKWIDEAKTDPTRIKRIALAVTTLSHNQGFREMLLAQNAI
jgi:hypothetical protein